MSEIIAVVNNKGGVGKTTTVLALGHAWARKGKRILFVDFDSQANLTDTLVDDGVEYDETIMDAVKNESAIPVLTLNDFESVVPASLSLANFDRNTSGRMAREFILADLLRPVRNNYDLILIDCPPALGAITYNALVAANHLVMVTTPDKFSYDGMSMMSNVFRTVRESGHLNSSLVLDGVVVTRYRKNRINDAWLSRLRAELGPLLVEPVVREATRIQQAASFRKNIYDFDPECGAVADYLSVSDVLYGRIVKNA